jgi:hypothetical protein
MSKITNYTVEELAKAFEYLDGLRESGITNMFGAVPYLAEHIGDTTRRQQASRDILSAWMETYSGEIAVEVRASVALYAKM